MDGVGQPSAAAFIPLGSPRWFFFSWVGFPVRSPVSHRFRGVRGKATAVALASAALLVAAGCGGDDSEDLTSEDALRDCLTEQGLTVEASDLSSTAGLGNASPDFQVTSGKGEIADVIVEGSENKADKTAADVQGAKQSFGAGNAVVVKEKNAVVVFEDEPPADFREQVETCV
jgi:hypothetical protein